jgi:hypothetical protein
MHIRRGDACTQKNVRACIGYDKYFQAAKLLVERYNLTEIVVLTDGDDFPVETFKNIANVSFASDFDRSKYRIDKKKIRKPRMRFPENRLHALGNATLELLMEFSVAVNCQAFVGTLSSSVSRVLFHLMLIRQGRVPPFVSVHACLRQSISLMVDEAGCEQQANFP